MLPAAWVRVTVNVLSGLDWVVLRSRTLTVKLGEAQGNGDIRVHRLIVGAGHGRAICRCDVDRDRLEGRPSGAVDHDLGVAGGCLDEIRGLRQGHAAHRKEGDVPDLRARTQDGGETWGADTVLVARLTAMNRGPAATWLTRNAVLDVASATKPTESLGDAAMPLATMLVTVPAAGFTVDELIGQVHVTDQQSRVRVGPVGEGDQIAPGPRTGRTSSLPR